MLKIDVEGYEQKVRVTHIVTRPRSMLVMRCASAPHGCTNGPQAGTFESDLVRPLPHAHNNHCARMHHPPWQVLTGGTNLLTKHKVHYIMAECNTGIIGEERGKKFIQFLHAQGYEVSPTSFKGPFWDASQIPTAGCSNINLYARRRP